jgi:hypothetical protein
MSHGKKKVLHLVFSFHGISLRESRERKINKQTLLPNQPPPHHHHHHQDNSRSLARLWRQERWQIGSVVVINKGKRLTTDRHTMSSHEGKRWIKNRAKKGEAGKGKNRLIVVSRECKVESLNVSFIIQFQFLKSRKKVKKKCFHLFIFRLQQNNFHPMAAVIMWSAIQIQTKHHQ